MNKIFKEVTDINLENKSIDTIFHEFFEIARKYNIKINDNDFDYNIILYLFLDYVKSKIEATKLIYNIVPEDFGEDAILFRKTK